MGGPSELCSNYHIVIPLGSARVDGVGAVVEREDFPLPQVLHGLRQQGQCDKAALLQALSAYLKCFVALVQADELRGARVSPPCYSQEISMRIPELPGRAFGELWAYDREVGACDATQDASTRRSRLLLTDK